MAKITEVFTKTSQSDIIAELKSKRYIVQPNVSEAEKQLDPLKHDVCNPIHRPDKKVKTTDEATENTTVVSGTGETVTERVEKVARVAVAIQKLIVKRAVAFIFGNKVKINAEANTDKEKMVHEALNRILKDNKSDSLNRRVARQVFSCCEAAEVWFPVPVEKTKTGSKVKDLINNVIGNTFHEKYGFKSKFKLRSAIFSPLLGDILYPYFDETGDMLAFSREYQRTDDNNVSHKFFETYTDENHFLWEMKTEGWTLLEGYPRKIEIGKIPVIYAHQESFEWSDVQGLINSLEKLLSDFDDSNAYHAWPKIFVTGEIKGFSKKGETGAIIEGEEGSKAEYLAYDQATESVKLEIETLLNLIYALTQTPDISFESVKGIGAISGVALKLLFLDAHLKVKDHQEVFDEYLQRRVNVIKAFISKFNTSLAAECDTLEIEPEITPFMIEDEKSMVELLTMANGNKPLVSQKLAAKLSNMAQDSEEDLKQMQQEQREESYSSVTEPTI